MDKIKKIFRTGTEVDDQWIDDEAKIYVLFEDEAKEPLEVGLEELGNILQEIASQRGVEIGDDVDSFYTNIYDEEILEQIDYNDPAQMEYLNQTLAEEKAKAEEKGATENTPVTPVTPVVPVVPTPGGVGEPETTPGENEEEYEDEEEIQAAKRGWVKPVVGGVLAAGALAGVGAMIANNINLGDDSKQDENNKQNNLDFDKASYEDIINSMDENDVRRQTAEQAMTLVNNFHEATHKDGNFRLEADQSTYLDLSFEEALVLTTFANHSGDQATLYDILGSFDFTGDEVEQILESARTKLITYYMNATEKSGLAELFQDPQDRMLFEQMENSVIAFRSAHTTETSDQVLRNVYYNYVLDSSTVAPNTSSMAKLLAFDAVYGGLILTETASAEHTQFLVFNGLSVEEETEKYVTDVLHLDYNSLTEEEKELYRKNIIPSGVKLIDLLDNGHAMNEENSTAEEMEKSLSLTDLVDRTGLCNAVNDEISSAISRVATTNEMDVIRERTLELNRSLADDLREAGYDDLANRVEKTLDTALSDDIKNEIRAINATFTTAVSAYENDMETIYGVNRPTMKQIANAAQKALNAKENYSADFDNVSTLINNRRHGVEVNTVLNQELTEEEKEAGIIGKEEDGTPVVDKEVWDQKTEEEKKDFIIENGKEVESEEEKKEEVEVKYEDLTSEEQKEADRQRMEQYKNDMVAYYSGEGQKSGNEYEAKYGHSFGVSNVVNPITGETFDITSMDFDSAIVYIQRYGNTYLDAETGLITRNGDFSLNASEDEQIQNAAEVAAENYFNGLSEEVKNELATGMGMSWDEAKELLKDSYKKGYVTQVQAVIDTAIEKGTELFNETRKAQEEFIRKTEEARQEAIAGENSNSTGDPVVVDEGSTGQEGAPEGGSGDTSANEDENVNNEIGTGDNTGAGAGSSSEDEYDPNIDEAFGQDEILVSGPGGSEVGSGSPSTGESGSTDGANNANAVVEAPSQDAVVEVPQVLANADENAELVENQLNPATTGQTSTTEEERMAAILSSYYNSAIEEIKEENSRGGRSR